MRAHRLFCFVAFFAVFCTSSGTTMAQSVYGSIKGTLTDISLKPIARASVTVASLGKGTIFRTVTDNSGFYDLNDVAPDDYSLRIEADGYKTFENPFVTVYADNTSMVNPKLVNGKSTEVVKGSAADVSVLKIDRTDVATVLTQNQITDLPLGGQPGQPEAQNVSRLQLLAPGAVPVRNTLSVVQNPQQAGYFNQNGQVFSGTAYQLDGTDNRDPVEGIVIINPNQEAVGEMKITTQNYGAEFGEATAGVVTVQTKSGANNFHGSLFEYRQTGWGQASEAPSPEITSSTLKRNQFGVSLGGPILKNRLFFFADYRGTRDVSGATLNLTVPTATVRQTCVGPAGASIQQDCNLADYQIALKNPPSGTVVDPANNLALLNSAVSPQMVYLLNLLPPPTSSGITNNYVANGREPLYSDNSDLRLDYDASQKLKLFLRYSYNSFRQDGTPAYGAAGGPGTNPDLFAGRARTPNQGISTGFSYSFSPHLLTDFRFGFLRYHLDLNAPDFGTSPIQNVISGLNTDLYSSDLPDFEIDQFPSLPAGVAPPATGDIVRFGYSQGGSVCNCPLREHEQVFQWVNNWTRIAGPHAFRWGGDFRFIQNFRLTSPTSRSGHLEFSSIATSFSLADFLIGQVDLFNRGYSDPANPASFNAGERQKRAFFYGEDTWRVNSRLTVNFGLRWEIYFPQYVSENGGGGFFLIHNNVLPSIENATINVAGTSGVNLQGNVQNSYNNFGPRFGLAYLVGSKTVIRAGYGRTFDVGYGGSLFGIAATENPPIAASPITNLSREPFQINSPTNPAPVPASQTTLNLSSLSGSFTIQQLCQATSNGGNTAAACTNPGFANPLPPTLETNLFALPSRIRVPTVDAWNLTVQHQLSPNMYFEVAYVGNKGTHVLTDGTGLAPSYNLNQPTLQGVVQSTTTLSNPVCNKYIINPAGGQPGYCTTLEFTRTPLTPWIGGVNYMGNVASDKYNSFQAKFSRRFSGGLSVLTNYVYSKLMDYDANYFAIDPRVAYGPGNFDRHHTLAMADVWSIPVGRGRALLGDTSKTADKIIGGWTLSAFTTWYSGLPFTPTYAGCDSDLSVGDVFGGGGVAQPCRPNVVGHVSTSGNRSQYFTTTGGAPLTAFGGNTACGLDASGTPQLGVTIGPWQRPGCGQIGNAGRNSLRGPGFFQSDIALMKEIPIKERVTLRLRVDAFNAFNKTNLGLPNATVDGNNGGQITSLNPAAIQRQFEFSAKVQF